MRYSIIITFLFCWQINSAQDTLWQNDFLPKDYRTDLYHIDTNKITKYYKDSIIDYEIEKLPNNHFIYIDWENSENSDIDKIETHSDEKVEHLFKIIYYKDGSYEKGLYESYFKTTYRKGYWIVFDNETNMVGFGKYKRFITLTPTIDMIGENKPSNLKQGKWRYIDTKGNELKVVKYRKGKIRKVKQLISSDMNSLNKKKYPR